MRKLNLIIVVWWMVLLCALATAGTIEKKYPDGTVYSPDRQTQEFIAALPSSFTPPQSA